MQTEQINFTASILCVVMCKVNTGKPVLTTTSEQQPPVCNGQHDPLLFNIESKLKGPTFE
jgi:hypothetical protein